MIASKCSSFEYARLLLVIAPGRENLSSSSVLKRSERKEAVPVTVRRTLGKLTGLRAWNFYLMPEPSSRRLHAFISCHLNTYKEVHGNVYGDVAAMLSTIPLSFGVLWSILSGAGRGSFPEEVRCARRNNCALVLRAAARLELPGVEARRVELVKAMACTPA
jgi:hypothetical protein